MIKQTKMILFVIKYILFLNENMDKNSWYIKLSTFFYLFLFVTEYLGTDEISKKFDKYPTKKSNLGPWLHIPMLCNMSYPEKLA